MLLTPEEWKTWGDRKRTIIDYQPKQLQPGYFEETCGRLDCGHRSPYFACCLPFCFLPTYYCCGKERVDILTEGDDILGSMLKEESELCPKDLRGVWWFVDNVSHERLVTLSDADWVTERYGVKDMTQQWANDWTCLGCFLSCCVGLLSLKMRMEISEDEEWIAIDYNFGGRQWMKRVKEEIYYPNDWWQTEKRGKVGVSPGDVLRLNYDGDTEQPTYQYVLKRVAYLDQGGNLVKTPQWEEYLTRLRLGDRASDLPFYLENRYNVVKYKK